MKHLPRASTHFVAITIACLLGCSGGDERVSSKVILPEQPEPVVEPEAATPQSATTSTPAAMESGDQTAAAETGEPMPEPMEPMAPEPMSDSATASSDTETETTPAEPVDLPRLHGRITVIGTPPELPALAVGAAAAACNVQVVPSEAVVVGPDGGLANCVIYLKTVPSGVEVPPPPSEPLIVDQKGCQFIPHVTFARVGQEVLYRNSDAFAHNVRTNPFRNPGFSTTAGPGQDLPYAFEVAETRPMQINCDIHRFMTAYQVVFDHPWCAISDENGYFQISGLPEGELEFVAWHEQKGYIERSFTLQIGADSDIERNYEIPASDLAD